MTYKSPIIKKRFLEKNDLEPVMKIKYLGDAQDVEMEEIHEEEPVEVPKNDLSEEIDENQKILDDLKEKIEILKQEKAKELLKITESAEQESAQIIKNAKKEADKIIKSSEARVAEKSKNAEKQGFENGFTKGMEQSLNQYKDLVTRADLILTDTSKIKKELLLRAEKQVVQLALAVAAKVVRYETSINPNIVSSAVRDSLKAINNREQIKICVNPGDMESLEKSFDEFTHILKSTENFSISRDPSITKGGFIIETTNGNLDGQIETALIIIEEEMKKAGQ